MAQETNGNKKLLAGVQVLDFTQYLAGPSATRLLADLGADVIKIERAPDGDLGRKIHLVEPGISAFFLAASAGKKSVGVEFKNPTGLEIVRELVRQVDVAVENYSPLGLWSGRAVRPSHQLRHHRSGPEWRDVHDR